MLCKLKFCNFIIVYYFMPSCSVHRKQTPSLNLFQKSKIKFTILLGLKFVYKHRSRLALLQWEWQKKRGKNHNCLQAVYEQRVCCQKRKERAYWASYGERWPWACLLWRRDDDPVVGCLIAAYAEFPYLGSAFLVRNYPFKKFLTRYWRNRTCLALTNPATFSKAPTYLS